MRRKNASAGISQKVIHFMYDTTSSSANPKAYSTTYERKLDREFIKQNLSLCPPRSLKE